MLNSWDSIWRFPIALLIGLLAGCYIGSMIATIYVMFILGEDLNTINFTEPWFFRYAYSTISANSAVHHTVLLITGIPTALLGVLGLTSVYRGKLTDYDDAHFQTRRELKRNRMLTPLSQNGFLFGKRTKPKSKGAFVSAKPDRFPHAVMVAPTGRGKGIGFVLPNLLHFQGSAVILDVKGENFEKTSVHRKEALDNEVWYFSPFDYVMPEDVAEDGAKPFTRTHRFNPLARIAALPSPEQQYTAINAMADLFLIVEAINAQSFFQAGRSLFVASCLYAIEKGKPTIGEALRIMTGGGSKKTAYLEAAAQTSNPTVAEIFLTMADETDKILDSYVSVIRGAGLELWLDPAVDRATSGNDFDFSTFRSKPQALYIVVQPEHLKTLAPLIRLLFADAIASLQRAPPGQDEPHTVMFLMDEFDQLGKQPLVLNSIKTIRSYGGRYFIISQSIPGIDSVYGETDRRSLQGGAGIQIYMTPQDDRTAEVLSAALGKKTVVSKTRSHSAIRKLNDTSNISRRSEERPLISPGETLRFPLNKVLVLAEGQYPILAHHIRYYEDHHFKAIDEARHGFDLPYPPLTEPVSATPPRIPKNIADGHSVAENQEDEIAALENGTVGFAALKQQAETKTSKRPTVSGTRERRPPKRKTS